MSLASQEIVKMIKLYIAEHDTLTWDQLETELDRLGVTTIKSRQKE